MSDLITSLFGSPDLREAKGHALARCCGCAAMPHSRSLALKYITQAGDSATLGKRAFPRRSARATIAIYTK